MNTVRSAFLPWRVIARRLFSATPAATLLAYGVLLVGQRCSAQQSAVVEKVVGTVKALSGNTVTLSPDSGPELVVLVSESARLVLVAPGQTTLKDAVPIQLSDLRTGDRILVRGAPGPDGRSMLAVSIIAMAKTEIAAKRARERDEWQRHGISGLVLSSDPAAGNVIIALPSLGDKKNVTVHIAKTTVLRRYAPDSVRFDDAKPMPIDQIKVGDQLRARGARTTDGSEFNADEVVTGAFRSIAGTVISCDAAAGTLTVQDLTTKRPVTAKVSADSQLRRLPPPVAQRIAARLKGVADPAAAASSAPSAAQQSPVTAPPGDSPASTSRAGDFQQMISRMPVASLSDLQKGEAVMVVATEGSATVGPSIVTLLVGVEPILQAAPSGATILTPWSLGAQGSEPGGP
jgi:hypothetical protein